MTKVFKQLQKTPSEPTLLASINLQKPNFQNLQGNSRVQVKDMVGTH